MKRDEGAMGHTTAIQGNNHRSVIAREACQDKLDNFFKISLFNLAEYSKLVTHIPNTFPYL